MWHASSSSLAGYSADKKFLRRMALDALKGVGDAGLGEWEEWSGVAYHVKRRLTPEEQESVGEPVDIRGTPEAIERHAAVQCYLPAQWQDHIV